MRRLLWTTAPLAIALVAAGCGAAIPSSNGGAAMVRAMPSENGRILVDSKGHTLYLFEKDEEGESYCDGACAAVWPPYETEAAPHAGGGLAGAALGTIKRPDGDLQVTYRGHPLYYYYASDASTVGKTKGEGLEQFGDEWYLVGPNGKPVEEEESGHGGSGGSGGAGGSGDSGGGGGGYS